MNRLNNLLKRCQQNFSNIHIMIIAQNWKDIVINDNNIVIYSYDKLGITNAREELRKKFLETDYDWMICFDDDFELNYNPERFNEYLLKVIRNPDCFIEYENYIMNLCAMSRYIARKYSFLNHVNAEDGQGFEDWIYVSIIQKADRDHYRKFSDMQLAAKKRKELVNDKYSTWINSNINKDEMTKKSIEIIKEEVKNRQNKS